MNITEQILIDSKGQLTKQLEPTDPNYSMFNTGGVECEVGEFLYGLVRMTKPLQILETGTHLGVGAAYIGNALRDNEKGTLTTLEFIPELHEKAQFLIDTLGLDNQVKCLLDDVTKIDFGNTKFDFIFLDTEPHLRFNELLKFWNNLKPGGIVIIHDLNPNMGQTGVTVNEVPNWPFGTLPQKIKDLMKSRELQNLHFATPRGIYIGQKRGEGFYEV